MTGHKRTIVFIDDDRPFLDMFTDILTEEGYDVQSYTDGIQAIEFIEQLHDMPVVVSDINMPSIGGLDILKKIRQINELIPVIMITGQADSEAFMEAINNQASYLLMKPFDIDQLVMFITKATERLDLTSENLKLVNDLSEKNMRLRRYSSLFKNIFDSLNLGVVLLDSTYCVIYFNVECEKIFGCLEEDILKENFMDSHILSSSLSELIQTGIDRRKNLFKYRDKNDNYFLVYSLRMDISDETFYLITFEDLTRIYELETELTKNTELVQIGKFSAMIAHEIRNPLTGMSTLCNYIEMNEKITSLEVKEIIADFNQEIIRMEALTDKILNASKNYDSVLTLGKTEILTKIHEMKRILSSMAPENLELKYDFSKLKNRSKVFAGISTDLLDQVIKNVFKNAVESIFESKAESGRITIRILTEKLDTGRYCVIEITDNGEGFSKFPNFEKESLFTTKKDGIGFGLAICNKILNSARGRLELFNNKTGATVRILIPESNE